MQRQFFSGNSIEQAVMAAARHYKIEPDKVAYKVREKKHGFVSIRRRIVIEVDPSSPELAEGQIAAASAEVVAAPPVPQTAPPSAAPSEKPAESRSGEEQQEEVRPRERGGRSSQGRDNQGRGNQGRDNQDRGRRSRDSRDQGRRGGRGRGRHRDIESVEEFAWSDLVVEDFEVDSEVGEKVSAFEFGIDKILDVMDLEIEYAVREEDGKVKVDFTGEDGQVLTSDDGRGLKAIEHILPRIVRGLLDESIPCRVDCEGFQANHEQELIDMACQAAKDVRDQGESKTLAPMNPADRRIIHIALVDNPDVETSSEGHGFIKKVRIHPAEVEAES